MFQSSPGLLAGCCPLAFRDAGGRRFVFQSSPGLLAGCCSSRRTNYGNCCKGFNPHPAFWPGAAYDEKDGKLAMDVSILTRPFDRVLPGHSPGPHKPAMRFNPHPAFWPGAAWRSRPALGRPFFGFNPHPAFWPGAAFYERGWDLGGVRVSILTRPFGRVLPQAGRKIHDGAIRFQSSPGLLAGCCTAAAPPRMTTSAGFNPHPAFWPGAATRLCDFQPDAKSFNPRPAFWPGAARLRQMPKHRGQLNVSILTRPFGRVLQASPDRHWPAW